MLKAEAAPTEPGADRAERLLAELNEPQREAVRHGEGPLLVLAGAGSGKTRVLTHRIAYLLATGAARPGEILAITFTNKAAKEMRERVEALVGRTARAMWVTTFHSACARMLRADAERLGYSRGFTIYDESDSLRMLKRCMDELHVDPKRYPPRSIRSQISGAKNQLVDAGMYAESASGPFEEVVAEAFSLYEKRMLEANAMDFDDLLVRTVNALELFEEVRERWRRAFRHVLVDEYQDTNHAQYRLLQLLTAEHGNLMVVGDEVSVDLRLPARRHPQHPRLRARLPRGGGGEARAELPLDPDDPLGRQRGDRDATANAARSGSGRSLAGGEPLQLGELSDEHEEARWVAGEIERLGEEEGVRREDVAVFYRTNAMSRVLEDTLVRFELPYQVIGGTKFYERAEIKDAVAYLSLLVNPADQVSLRPGRQLAAPRDRQDQPGAPRLPRQHDRAADLGGRRPGRGGAGPGRRGDQGGFDRFHETIEGLAGARRCGPRSPSCWRRLLRETGYLEALAAERTVEAEGRAENLEELVGVAAEFDVDREMEGEGELRPLEEFLQQISLYTEQDELRDESVITLMTLHNAKGLEYETVLIVGCEDGAFPHMQALEEGGEEEERRLCYVGITRARKRLYMTWARERRLFGRAERNLPSRFVDELPEELAERELERDRRRWSRRDAGRLAAEPLARRRWSCSSGRRHRPCQLRRRCRYGGRAAAGSSSSALRATARSAS